MARYDVYPNPEASERKHTPYLLDVQNDYIDALTTRVVVPLRTEAAFGPRARNLNGPGPGRCCERVSMHFHNYG